MKEHTKRTKGIKTKKAAPRFERIINALLACMPGHYQALQIPIGYHLFKRKNPGPAKKPGGGKQKAHKQEKSA